MRSASDYIKLYDYNSTTIKDMLSLAGTDVWDDQMLRQLEFDAHSQTKSILYVWTHPLGSYTSPDILIGKHIDKLSEAVWTSAEKIRAAFNINSKIVRLMLAKVPPGGVIKPHCDHGNLKQIHRCHHVILSNEFVEFNIGNNTYNFKEGEVFEFNNQEIHSVNNNGSSDRVHLICDIL